MCTYSVIASIFVVFCYKKFAKSVFKYRYRFKNSFCTKKLIDLESDLLGSFVNAITVGCFRHSAGVKYFCRFVHV